MPVVLVVHHSQDPAVRARPLSASFPLAAHESSGPIFSHPSLVGQFPVIDIFPAAIAAHVGDAALIIIA